MCARRGRCRRPDWSRSWSEDWRFARCREERHSDRKRPEKEQRNEKNPQPLRPLSFAIKAATTAHTSQYNKPRMTGRTVKKASAAASPAPVSLVSFMVRIVPRVLGIAPLFALLP